MKYYSEKLQKLFDSVEMCQKAELEAQEQENRERIRKEREAREKKEKEEKRSAERKAKAAEVEEARKAMVEAQHKYREVLESFIKQYGSFHLSLTGEDAKRTIPTLFDFFDLF